MKKIILVFALILLALGVLYWFRNPKPVVTPSSFVDISPLIGVWKLESITYWDAGRSVWQTPTPAQGFTRFSYGGPDCPKEQGGASYITMTSFPPKGDCLAAEGNKLKHVSKKVSPEEKEMKWEKVGENIQLIGQSRQGDFLGKFLFTYASSTLTEAGAYNPRFLDVE